MSLATSRNTVVADNLYTLLDFGNLRNFIWHQLNRLDLERSAEDGSEIVQAVLLKAVDEPWPFPPN